MRLEAYALGDLQMSLLLLLLCNLACFSMFEGIIEVDH